MKVGGWVQATEDVTERDFNGAELWTHARRGALGRVVQTHEDPELATVTWEVTGTTTDCHVSEFQQIDPAEVGWGLHLVPDLRS